MAGQAGPVGRQAGIRFLQQRLGVGLHRAQHPVFLVQRRQRRQQRLHIGIQRPLAVAAKAAQAAGDGPLRQHRLGPPVGPGLRPLRLQLGRIERGDLFRPARSDLLPMLVARQSMLRQRMHPGARARLMRLARQAGGHAGRPQQHIGQLVQRGMRLQAQAGRRLSGQGLQPG